MAEIIIAKHRNGAVGDIQLRFRSEQAKFMELDDDFGIPVYDDQENASVKFESRMNRSNTPQEYNDAF